MNSTIEISSKIKKFNKLIKVPGDKSISIRSLLLSSQAVGISKIYNLLESDDVISTINSLRKLGIKIIKKKNRYFVYGRGLDGYNYKNNTIINAGNSGTFARLICGLIASNPRSIKLIGDKSLSRRDFSRVIKPLSMIGVNFKSKNNKLPQIITGNNLLRPITYKELKGSSQVKSSIMLAALNTPGTTILKCIPSRNHTELMFKNCLKIPISVKKNNNFDVIRIKGGNRFNRFDYTVPGDISSASFFIVLTILSDNSEITIKNVNINNTRTGIIDIIKKMNAKVKFKNKKKYKGEINADILVKSSKNLKSINCPKSFNTRSIDEFLIIFLLCAKANGISKFNGIQELRHKESDRLKVASNFLKMIGVKVEERFDSLKIYGNPKLYLSKKYVIKNYFKDHRVFMMACVAALTLGGTFEIHDKESIKSSFPNFLNIIKELGAKYKIRKKTHKYGKK